MFPEIGPFKSIRTSTSLVLGLLIVLGGLSVGTTLWVVRSQAADALIINLAGSERWQSQQIAKLALLGAQRGQAQHYLTEIDAAGREWEQVFSALRDGGTVVYEGRTVSLPPTTDPAIRAQLARVWRVWQPFYAAAHAVLENPAGTPAFNQGMVEVAALSEELLLEMDRAVQLYETAAAARVARVEQIQLLFLLSGAVVAALGLIIIRSQIIHPLEMLTARVGHVGENDLGSPVPLGVKNEIGTLTATFDGMRQRLHRRFVEQAALLELAQRLAGLLDAADIFDRTVATTQEILCADRVSLLLFDEQRENLFLRAGRGWEQALYGKHKVSAGTACAVDSLRLDQAVWLTHATTSPNSPFSRDLHPDGFHSTLAAALIVEQEALGVVCAHFREPRPYGDDEGHLLSLIANQAALAYERARLYRSLTDEKRLLELLYDLARALADAAHNFDTILNLVARCAVETIHVTFARVALRDGHELVLHAAHPKRGLNDDLGVGQRQCLTALPFCQRVLEQNTPVVIHANSPEVHANDREFLRLGLAQTLCLVPLRSGNRVFGLLMLGEARHAEREPFASDKIRLTHNIGDQAASALHRAELFTELENAYLQTVLALAKAVDAKDTYTADHAARLAAMSLAIGSAMGMVPSELEALRYGAILHDIGKIGVPDAILQKPAQLDPHEWLRLRQHPLIGAQILAPVARLAEAARIVQHHHERYDGTGYPCGLAGEAIPLGARILTVVDSYSAIIDERVYKPPRSHHEALEELKKNAGTQFDPQVVATLLELWERGLEMPRDAEQVFG